jgi:hypothetical protein
MNSYIWTLQLYCECICKMFKFGAVCHAGAPSLWFHHCFAIKPDCNAGLFLTYPMMISTGSSEPIHILHIHSTLINIENWMIYIEHFNLYRSWYPLFCWSVENFSDIQPELVLPWLGFKPLATCQWAEPEISRVKMPQQLWLPMALLTLPPA